MSFSGHHTKVKEGDTVIIYISPMNVSYITAKHGDELQNSLGCFPHEKIIGSYYGSKISSKGKFAHKSLRILYPTPEIWTRVLKHRTQVLYLPDISMVCLKLDLKPGSVVLETGTGSGSLTHSLARSVMPNGHVHTFDFHEVRSKQAAEEFKLHSLDEIVTSTHHDAYDTNGFPSQLHNKCDAAFLDLPAPWNALENVTKVLKSTGSRLCSFSPCIEQVQRMCICMANAGYLDIQTVEVLDKEYMVKKEEVKEFDPLDDYWKQQGDSMVQAKLNSYREKDNNPNSRKRKANDLDKTEGEKAPHFFPEVQVIEMNNKKAMNVTTERWVTQPVPEMRGHTGYLTFATWLGGQ